MLVTNDLDAARADVRAKLSGVAFGDAGAVVVIEEGLDGEECSLFVLCDGTDVIALVTAQDFKRVGDGDQGANTGGMGAYAPMRALGASDIEAMMERIIRPTVRELRRRGIDYRGVFYAGIMMTSAGVKLLEYNVRFGDPRGPSGAPALRRPALRVLRLVGEGRLGDASLTASGAAVTVISPPRVTPKRPSRVTSSMAWARTDSSTSPMTTSLSFTRAPRATRTGAFVTNGGRVLAITGFADDVATARQRAYDAASHVNFRGSVRRSDIARRAAEGER